MIPILKFKEITIKIGSGSTPKGGNESYKDFGISLIRSMNVYDFIFKHNGLAFIDEKQANKLKNVTVEENDILLNITGASVARCCMVPNDILPARVNQHVSIIRVDKAKANPKYVLFYINSPSYKSYILGLSASGATREALTKEVIENLTIPLPPLSIQQKIASILSSYDELIENNKQRIKLLEEMAEEIYKEWFVRLRFPGYENAKIVNGLPDGWVNGTIGDLVEFKKGKNITLDTVSEGNIPVVAGGLTPAYFHNIANTISPTITISASGANAGFVNLYYEDIWASDCSYLDSNSTGTLFFFYLTLKTRQKEVFFLQKGSAQPHVYPKDIMTLKIIKPSSNLVKQFEDLIVSFFEEIKVLNQKNQLLQETRDLLLPRLISGKLSVEHLVEEDLVADSRAEYQRYN